MPFVKEHRSYTVTIVINIEVAYALPEQQEIIALSVDEGCTAEQAIMQSGILTRYPNIDLQTDKIGIFSKICPLSKALRDKDRVEIYRPLIADPKEARRKKAAEQRRR